MSAKIIVGPFNRGQRTDRLPFVIDNESFPVLRNAYQWRGRVKRKRGTSLLVRLKRYFDSTSLSYNSGSTTITLNGSGAGNILTGFSLESTGNIVPGTVTITASGGPTVYTDPTIDGYLTPTGTGGPNTINYATGDILIPAQAGNTATVVFSYYPCLPVMGLEDFVLSSSAFPGTIAFDTKHAYNIVVTTPHDSYDVSFYKNLATGTYPGYIQKTNPTSVSWNGEDYQQFWTVNYLGALWVTNGIKVPFTTANIGMQFKSISNIAIINTGPPVPGPRATATLTINAHGLVQGDFVFINEVVGVTGINFQTGYVISPNPQAANTVVVEFPEATLGGAYSSGGIAQYLTSRSDNFLDCIRWYDGDPTNADAVSPVLSGTKGWVNFMPPLSQSTMSIGDLPEAQYYLVGCRMIVPFKDRLLFLGVVVQSSGGSPVYLQDTIVYSQNGTPYYTASFTENTSGFVTDPTIVFTPLLVPTNQTATPSAYFADVTGFGGFVTAGIDEPIITSATNKDTLLIGFQNSQSRLIYKGDDILPFEFYQVSTEFGSISTFSAINMGESVLTKGSRGYVSTTQVNSDRFDDEIPTQAFEVDLTKNGNERFTAQRDFLSEWIYFTYPSNEILTNKFPNTTLLYNYKDNSWATFIECYTTYGQFRERTGYTWQNIGTKYKTWNSWNTPWNSLDSTLLNPKVIAGTPQGFVMMREDSTGEGTSITITSFSGNVVTSPNHGLNNQDFIVISGALGTIGSTVNGIIFQVYNVSTNAFSLSGPAGSPTITGTYYGGGLVTRMYKPFIQTKQFPAAWGIARKTRIGSQQYLLTGTEFGQVSLLIYLSQNSTDPYNDEGVVPEPGTINNSLVYSTVLYTCPESTNLGLTAANINLQQIVNSLPPGDPVPIIQDQIWHRLNTSLIGDTVQVAITLSDTQMRDVNFKNQFTEIELHGFIIDVSPSGLLA